MTEEFDNTLSNKQYYNKYIELLFKYNQLNEKFTKKNEIQKKASIKYFNTKKKYELKHCEICNCDVNITSFNTHLKSKKHNNYIIQNNQIKELQK
jgi:hypothetical protein